MKTFEKIYQVVATIPSGKVSTYKMIADLAQTTPRVVGFAMRINKNTKTVPCHRVVGIHGDLKGYAFGGVNKKRKMLIKEGVSFKNQETVDLLRSAFSF